MDGEKIAHSLANVITVVKTNVLAIGPKCSPEVVHLAQAQKTDNELIVDVENYLNRELKEALQGLSQWKPPR